MTRARTAGAALAALALLAAPLVATLFPDAIGDLVDALERPAPPDEATCAAHFAAAIPPAYRDRSLERRATTICYHAFSIGYSGATRTPLWSAEHLTAASVDEARTFGRHDDFHPDPYVRRADRARLDDYRGSGFDRGHMSPSGDMPTPEAREESFTLANIVPQDRDLNEHLWAGIEGAVRGLARRYGAVYVVSGPVFDRAAPPRLHDRVAVPSAIYKAVLVPGVGAAAYLAPNAPGYRYETLSVEELAERVGIDPFPGEPAKEKRAVIELPAPRTPHRHARHRSRHDT
ncbi:DNA/RNA non-specific endonuclease [Sphingomonas sp. BK069]|uniref:DNA/RNA non-specific endonuclease n=1 Tax=Sphingomonas sp. BK069 TaxID=2586979 RepID=UPI001616B04E|nr:DNA/RNA non-specific endonuclease [Sphingomonas sp. BK069]MBB3346042.1 endonuclease G [Sphingomonas sp. BK069]